ncbi:hypothetical protein RX455_000267 [Vibrio fluvialis]|nr:hypothetical protein [Vibrio fluvialis]
MKFSEIYNAIKSHFLGFLTFVILFSVSAVYLVSEYKDIQLQKSNITSQLLALKDLELALEREKSKFQLEVKDKNFELSRRENQVRELTVSLTNSRKGNESTLLEKERNLDLLKKQYESKLDEVKKLHVMYSNEAIKSKAEDKVLTLMKEFSDLGVDISEPDWCDKDYTKRYYKGVALIDQIRAINTRYALGEEFGRFVLHHTRGITWSSDDHCQSNKS